MKVPIIAKIQNVRAITKDCTTITIYAKITDGPQHLIDRRLEVVITPERDNVILVLQDLLDVRQKALDNRKEQSVISEV